MAWPTAEQRAATKKGAAKKPATKPTVSKTSVAKVVKLPKETTKKRKNSKILPLKTTVAEGKPTYRGEATLGSKKVRSSPTSQRISIDGLSYVLVPEHEHNPVDTAKRDALIVRLRELRNELFEDGNCDFTLAGKQIGIAIALLRDGGGEDEEDASDGDRFGGADNGQSDWVTLCELITSDSCH